MDEFLLKICAAVAPALILIVLMVRKDPQREPLRWLWGAAGLGVLSGLASLAAEALLLPDLLPGTYFGAVYTSFVGAALPEETFKFLALWLLCRRNRHFDELFDGVVYAVCIGMGFAAFENILYLVGADDEWLMTGAARALLATPAHYFFAVIMGAFFALGRFDRRNRRFYYPAALAVPVIVHGLYDALLFASDVSEALSGSILMVFFLGFAYIRRFVKRLVKSMLKLDEYGSEAKI